MASRPIDEKIVAMKMDNSDFKRKASETVGLFGKLSESLGRVKDINMNSVTGAFGKMKESLSGVNKIDFSRVTNSISSIKSAAQNVDMSTLASNVDNITQRFGNLNTVATAALATITAKATLAGTQMMQNLGPAQVSAGFQEYEKKMGSIGTMLSNTEWAGSDLNDVKKTLGELNDYADNTIYSFGQMTDNIGRFTAAGVTLEDSATAIKGLGNLAAVSGSNTDQLNTAMYQMSQALSSGKLNLMDWNSLINAGMGGKKTQDALLDTAAAMGMNVDMSEGFRNSIQDGWLTSEVLLATLKQFGEDESMTKAATSVRTFTGMMSALQEGIGSGWSESFEIIFGDFHEATKLWTGLSNIFKSVFDVQAKSRNAVLRAIFDGGGLANLLGIFMNIGKPFVQVFKAIGEGFKLAFPTSATSVIGVFLEMFQYLTKNMQLSKASVANITTIFAGFFSIFAIGGKLIAGAVQIILALLPSFSGLGASLLELIAIIAAIPLAFNESSSSGDTFVSFLSVLKTVAGGIATVLGYVVAGLIILASAVAEIFNIFSNRDFSGVGPWKEDSAIVDRLFRIRDAVVTMAKGVMQGWNILVNGDFTKGPWEEDSMIVDWLFKLKDGFKNIGQFVKGIDFGAIGTSIGNFIVHIGDSIAWAIDKAKEMGKAIMDAIPNGDQLMAGGAITGMIAVVGLVLKTVWDFFTGWGQIGKGVSDTLESVSGALNSFTAGIYVQALFAIALAVGVLAASFYMLSKLNAAQIGTALYAMIGGLSAIVLAMFVMTKYDITGTGMKAAIQVVALSVAFAILAGAMKSMSTMKWDEIAKGIVGLAGTIGVFSLAVIAMSKFGGNGQVGASALQFIAIAAAMHIMFSAVQKFGGIDTGVLVKGTIALGVVLLQLGLFAKAASGFGIGSAIGIIGVTAAVLAIVGAISLIAVIPTEILVKGLYTITAILAALAIFSQVAAPGLLATGVGVALIAGALLLLTVPIGILGNMDTDTLVKGLYSMAIALAAIGVASMMMTGLAAAGVGLVLVAGALILLMIPIAAFSAMSWEGLLKGMVGLAASLLIIGGAAALLTPVIPSLLAFGIALVALGAGMALAGLGIALFSTGMVTAAAMTGTAIITIVSMLGTLIAGLVSLIPAAVDFATRIIMHMAGALEQNAPIMYEKMLALALKLLSILDEHIPQFTAKAGDIITSFIDGMAVEIPRIIESIANLMVQLAAAVEANKAPFLNAWLTLMSSVAVVMVSAGAAVVEALFGWIPGVGDVATQIGNTAEESIVEAFEAQKIATDKGSEFADGLSGTSGKAEDAGNKVGESAKTGASATDLNPVGDGHGTSFITGLMGNVTGSLTAGMGLADASETGANTANLSPIGSGHGMDFASSILGTSGASQNAGTGIANAVEGGAGTGNLSPIGSGHGADFASGVSTKVGAAQTAGTSIAKGAQTGAGSVSASTTGAQFGQGFAAGLNSSVEGVRRAAENLAATAASKMRNILDIHSPSRVTKKIGDQTGEGFVKGMDSKKKAVSTSAKNLAKTAKDGFNEAMDSAEHKFKMGTISEKEYIAELNKIKKTYSKHPEMVRKVETEIKEVQKDSAKHKESLRKKEEDKKKKSFDAEKSRLDDLKYYGKLTLQQELVAWTKMANQYKKGTDQKKEADREVFRIKKEIRQEDLNDEKDKIDDLDYYGKLTLDKELAYYQELVKKHKAGSDERRMAEREVYRVKKEMSQKILDDEKERLDKEKDMIADKKHYNQLSLADELEAWQKLNAKYKKGTEERKNAEREIYRLKNEINRKLIDLNDDYTKKVQDANKKLIDDEKALNEQYNDALDDRAKSLAGFTSIFEKVAKASRTSGSTLMGNLRGQVQAFSKWSVDIDKLSKRGIDKGLMETLREMGPQSAGEIAALNTMTDEQLQEYSGLWKEKNKLARSEATTQLQGMKADTARKIQELRSETAAQLDVYKTEWLQKITEIRMGTEGEFVGLKDSMLGIGNDAIKGLMEGMQNMTPELMAQAKAMADAVSKTIKTALKIKSPSKVTDGFGQFVSIGLANGMRKKVGIVEASALNVAETAKNAMSNMLDDILPKDETIHLNVVVNSDDLNLGVAKLPVTYAPDTSFVNGLASMTTDAVRRQNGNNYPRETARPSTGDTKPAPNINQTLNFHTKEMTPSEVARKNLQVSRQLAMDWG